MSAIGGFAFAELPFGGLPLGAGAQTEAAFSRLVVYAPDGVEVVPDFRQTRLLDRHLGTNRSFGGSRGCCASVADEDPRSGCHWH